MVPFAPLPADIILYPVTPQSALSSRLVAVGELLWGAGKGSVQYSHAAIYAGETLPGRLIEFEAKWPKTGLYPVDSSRPYEIWRVEGITDEQRGKVLDYCAEHCGEWYDIGELVTFGLIQHHKAAVCSQFVGRAHDFAGIHLDAEGKPLLSPNAIPDNKIVSLGCRVDPLPA